MTSQRRAVLDVLRARRWHPTADEVFAEVRRRMPRISLGTVYRSLELLSRERLVSVIEVPGGPRRYDGVTEEHMHARCLRCGAVGDVKLGPEESLSEELEALVRKLAGSAERGSDTLEEQGSGTGLQARGGGRGGFSVTGVSLELVGICSRCSGNAASSRGVLGVSDSGEE